MAWRRHDVRKAQRDRVNEAVADPSALSEEVGFDA
jgi:hypothetical protein